ncbi:MAG: family 14 glycosylhydrolase [Armatimonadota bacterium]|nr:family 14 glycosylhydrolase [Armatimonadota bacterium]
MVKIRITCYIPLAIAVLAVFGACTAWAADSVSFEVGGKAAGIVVVDNFDGHFKEIEAGGRKALVNMIGEDQASLYIYFQVAEGFMRKTPPQPSPTGGGSSDRETPPQPSPEGGGSRDLYVTIDYRDSPRQVFTLEYNGVDPYVRGPQGITLGTGAWVKSTYRVENAKLSHGQNGGADFRIMAPSGLTLNRIEASWTPKEVGSWPSALERLDSAAKDNKGRRPSGMEYTFGNGASDDSAVLYRSLGVTSIETYVTWETCERKGKGEWDWSEWDDQVEILKRNGLKWVPFVILGPAYSTPDWFRGSEDHYGCVCLEHNITSKIESLWNPHLPAYIDRFLGEFAKRYGDTGVIESVLLGIQGDFGEAIYSVFGGGWTFKVPGEYHNHAGFWCGDEYALKSFRSWAISKYGSLEKVNEAWGTDWKSADSIDFPARGEEAIKKLRQSVSEAPTTTKRRWLDFVEWYRGEMTRFSDWWIATTKKHFPKTPIYLCTGGHAPPEHGANFAAQCKVAAKHGQGVRITNEASNYANNFAITRWVAAAGKFYGAFYGFEPAGGEDEKGIVARIYNATASGARQLHDYQNNVVNSQTRQDVQQKHIKFLRKSEPVVETALWYPNVALTLKEGDYLRRAAAFRDLTDYDYLDEDMLRDGALERYKVLVIIYGDVMERSDMEIIERWVRKGGTVLAGDFGVIKTVEGDSGPYERLFPKEGGARALDKGKTVLVPRSAAPKDFLATLSGALKASGVVNPDCEPDGVYATLLKGNKVLFLNTNEFDVKKTIVAPGGGEKKVTVKANTITEVGF